VSVRPAEAFGAAAERYTATETDRYVPDLVLGMCEPRDDDRHLDLGAGPGTLTSLLEPHVRSSVGLDVTREMLDRYRARTMGHPVLCDAAGLPFADRVFTLVTCGSVFHHLEDPRAVATEVHRVLGPGGRFLVIDMAGPEHPRRREIRDEVERVRDPSHRAILAPLQMRAVLQEAGFEIRAEERQVEDVLDKPWVRLMGGDLEAVRALLARHEREAAGFLALQRIGGGFSFRRERGYYLAVRP
jgi:ubiquinone/menaquinone biosynthesis C-methylase UbiE